MKLLRDILYRSGIEEVIGSTAAGVPHIAFDSRRAQAGGMFIAVRGLRNDGHDFIGEMTEKGITSVVCEILPQELRSGVTYVRVRDSAEALGVIASNFYDNPSSRLKLTGVTGTNGKTTSVTLLYSLFIQLGYKCGLLSTVANRINQERIEATHTTPDPLQLNELLDRMVKAGCTHCFMEVSSHAVAQRRIAGLEFSGALFTNITHDHLDYHVTFDNYLRAKKGFFDQLGDNAFALVNADDRNHRVMVQNTRARVATYSLRSVSDFKAKILENSFNGLLLTIDSREVHFLLVGSFNAYNLLGVYASAVMLGLDSVEVLRELSAIGPPEGRFETIISNSGIIAIVDYAHTPDALKNVLSTIQDIRLSKEQIITVVGCGGDRDREKRPLMASIALEMSDKVILTSDNPRSEDPEKIIEQMKEGVSFKNRQKVLTITDRAEALRAAVMMAGPGDIILVAGKGHEKYQEVKGVRHPFDDKLIMETLFQES